MPLDNNITIGDIEQIQKDVPYYLMKFLDFISSIARTVSLKITESLNSIFVKFGVADKVYASESWGRLLSVVLTFIFIILAIKFSKGIMKVVICILLIFLLIGLFSPW